MDFMDGRKGVWRLTAATDLPAPHLPTIPTVFIGLYIHVSALWRQCQDTLNGDGPSGVNYP